MNSNTLITYGSGKDLSESAKAVFCSMGSPYVGLGKWAMVENWSRANPTMLGIVRFSQSSINVQLLMI